MYQTVRAREGQSVKRGQGWWSQWQWPLGDSGVSSVSCVPQSSKGRGASVLWWESHEAGLWGGAGTRRKARAVFPDPTRINWLDPSVPSPTSVLKRRGCVGSLGTQKGSHLQSRSSPGGAQTPLE